MSCVCNDERDGCACDVSTLCRFSGAAAFNFYAVTIFSEAFGGSLNPHLAAVVTGSLQLLASCLSGPLSDLLGRLPLLVVSSGLMALALAAFGAHAFCLTQAECARGVAGWDWLPLLAVVLFVCAFSLGLNPVSWLLMGEVFPLEHRGSGSAVATAFSYVCAFVGVKTFVDLRGALGLHGTFWLYAVVAVVGLVYSLVLVPETKGRTLDEMKPDETPNKSTHCCA